MIGATSRGRRNQSLVRLSLAAMLATVVLIGALTSLSAQTEADPAQVRQMMTKLPKPIQAFIDASNRGDAAAVIACFTPTAVLDDWGRSFVGHAGIADWDRADNTGVQSQLAAINVETVDTTVIVTVNVRGNGFNGRGHMHFKITGDRISRLDIK
jgi:hypothetical protein